MLNKFKKEREREREGLEKDINRKKVNKQLTFSSLKYTYFFNLIFLYFFNL